MAAAVFDGVDGRLARALKGTTRFGAELDQLADFVDFGVAPALTLYFWNMHEIKSFGWFAAMVFAIACALRLARFNVGLDDPDKPAWTSKFFTGMPAPAGAIVALLPLYLHLSTLGWIFDRWAVGFEIAYRARRGRPDGEHASRISPASRSAGCRANRSSRSCSASPPSCCCSRPSRWRSWRRWSSSSWADPLQHPVAAAHLRRDAERARMASAGLQQASPARSAGWCGPARRAAGTVSGAALQRGPHHRHLLFPTAAISTTVPPLPGAPRGASSACRRLAAAQRIVEDHPRRSKDRIIWRRKNCSSSPGQ